MNFFDIRRLQASLSMIRVAFIKCGIDLNDAAIAAFLDSIRTADIGSKDFNGEQLNADALIELITLKYISTNKADVIEGVVNSVLELIYNQMIDVDIKTAGLIDPVMMSNIDTPHVNGEIKAGAFTRTDLVNKIAANAILSIRYKDLLSKDILARVLEAIKTQFKENELMTVVPLEKILTVNPDVLRVFYDKILVEDDEIVSAVTSPSHQIEAKKLNIEDVALSANAVDPLGNPFAGKVAIVSRSVAHDLATPDAINAASKDDFVISLKKIVTDTVDSYLIQAAKTIESIDTSAIARIAESSRLIGAIDLDFAGNAKIKPAGVYHLLTALGIDDVLTTRTSTSDSELIECGFVNIADMLKDIGVSGDGTSSINGSIFGAFQMIVNAELNSKNIVSTETNPISTGTTIYAFIDEDSAMAVSSVFKLVFGAQASVYQASSGIRDICQTDFDADINAELSMPTVFELAGEQNITSVNVKCRLGARITKFLRDYKSFVYGDMKNETLGSLCIQEI